MSLNHPFYVLKLPFLTEQLPPSFSNLKPLKIPLHTGGAQCGCYWCAKAVR